MSTMDENNTPGGGKDDLDLSAYRDEFASVERRLAREIDPGIRAVIVAVLVFVLMVALLLPNTGGADTIDILFNDEEAQAVRAGLPERLFGWFTVVFGIGFSGLALITRRWGVAWIALAGTAVGATFGMLAIWSRQTAALGMPGPGFGLYLTWATMILLTFHWLRVVWQRTAAQLAEEKRQRELALKLPQEGVLRRNDLKRAEGKHPETKRGEDS